MRGSTSLANIPGIKSVGVPFGLSFFLTPGPPGAAELVVLDFSCLLAILKQLRERAAPDCPAAAMTVATVQVQQHEVPFGASL